MDVREKLKNWCPRPKKPFSKYFTRSTMPIFISILTGTLVVIYMIVLSIYPASFLKVDESGWGPKELERISFPGGSIVVTDMRNSPFEEPYISIHIEAHINSEEDLSAYVNSRTNALNALLDSMAPDAVVEIAAIVFKDPLTPEDFVNLYKNSFVKIGEYAVIVKDEESGERGAGVLWFPRPEDSDFVSNLTSIKDGYKLEGIIAVEGYIKAEVARSLQYDPKVLLIDVTKDPFLFELEKKYSTMGYGVQVERAFFREMWAQYVKFKYGVVWVSIESLDKPTCK